MALTDFQAVQKWAKIPKHFQQLILKNVFCSNCGVTTIVEYTLHNEKYGILLEGKCIKCGKDVARLVEDNIRHF